MTKKVTITTQATFIKVWIDGEDITLVNGTGTAMVTPGGHHAISWSTRGAPGSSYSLAITEPPEAKLKRGDTFDADGLDVGVAWFQVLALFLLVVLGSAWPALAQGGPAAAPAGAAASADAGQVQVLRTLKLEGLADASGASAVSPSSSFSFVGSAADKIASAQLSLQTGSATLTFGLKAPLTQSSGRGVFADLDGLRNKATVQAGFLWSHWNEPDPAAILVPACEAYARDAHKNLNDVTCSLLHLRHAGTPEERALASRISDQLRKTTKPMYLAGVNATFGPETFRFVKAPSLTSASESHDNWSLTATGGMVMRNGLVLSGSYTHQLSYDAQSSQQICSPFGAAGSGVLTCSDRIVGAPDRSRSEQAAFELRRFFGEGFAVSPRVTHDFTQHVTGIDLPVYFIRNDTGGLTCGVAIGWRSDRNGEVTLTAFVGQVLGLISK